ncbi:MAG: hypothetical protein KDJ19_05240 [Hyphomicrobiaceae bacterium]|nr:hypothetical protein [Hyphomicrobiaceae bacterium]
MTNSGQVFGYDFAIYAVDTDGVFRNSGDISGGADAIYISSASASRIVNEAGGRISGGVAAIELGAGKDSVINRGEISGDVLLGYGDDTFKGRSGIVIGTVSGGNGDDTLIGSSVDDDDLSGGDNNDTLKGRDGDDTLDGGSGRDHLFAGRGNDELTGGTQRDYFHFGRNQGENTISDYEDGTDRIDLTAFGFASKGDALGKFFEIGSGSNNKVGFDYKGTFIMIKGADLGDINNADLLI